MPSKWVDYGFEEAFCSHGPSSLAHPPPNLTPKSDLQPLTPDPLPQLLRWQVVFDKHMGDLVYIRCYSGMLSAKVSLSNTTRGKAERPSKVMRVIADDYEEVFHSPQSP